MLKNFIKISLRNFKNNTFFTLINVAGLTVGILCFMFIAVWVNSELSYDKHNENADRIFRIYGKVTTASEEFSQGVTSAPFAEYLKKDFPEVENTVRLAPIGGLIKYGDKIFQEDGVLFVDSSFFEIYTVDVIAGDINNLLSDPNSIVLTERMAEKYFGDENPVGKTIKYENAFDLKVTGILNNPPQTSHFTFDCLVSFEKIYEIFSPEVRNSWFDNAFFTYLLLKNPDDYLKIEEKLPAFAEKYLGEKMNEYKMYYDFKLQSILDIHLKSDLRYEIDTNGNIDNIIIFGIVGVLVLLLACINYINMATAVASKRSREVGVKKVLGAFRKDLIKQFVIESFIITFISLAVSVILFEILLPEFQNSTGKIFENIYSFENIATIITVLFAVSLISGLYPAFVISSYKPNEVLKANFTGSSSKIFLRKFLVFFQNSVSIALTVSIIIIASQLNYLQSRNLGYKKEHLVVINFGGSNSVQKNLNQIKSELKSNSSISNASASSNVIVNGLSNGLAYTVDKVGQRLETSIYRLMVDMDYIDTYGMKIIEGRNFIDGAAYDSVSAFIINESAVKNLGWDSNKDAIGKPFSIGRRKGEIIGVVNDFNFTSLQNKIDPVVILVAPAALQVLTLQVQNQNISATFDYINKIWKQYAPEVPLDMFFMDEAINKQYSAEVRFQKIFFSFAAIALIIAALGLLGMASFTVRQKFKEIGIRKVLGASTKNLIFMIIKDFLIIVLLANLAAWPAAYYFMNNWLSDFAYKVEIGMFPFVAASLAALVLSIITVSYQALKAAVANPVTVIKYE